MERRKITLYASSWEKDPSKVHWDSGQTGASAESLALKVVFILHIINGENILIRERIKIDLKRLE